MSPSGRLALAHDRIVPAVLTADNRFAAGPVARRDDVRLLRFAESDRELRAIATSVR